MNAKPRYAMLAAALCACCATQPCEAQTKVRYTGTELSDPNRHDGALSPVVGVHNIQIMRANR